MKFLVFVSILALAFFMACSDSPDAPSGSLPVVQNCRIMETESKGDTVTIAWDAVTVEVDGYRVWFANTDPGTWNIIAQVEGTTTEHIATSTGYYCVDAIEGINSSEDQSNKANDRSEMYFLSDTLTVGGNNGIKFEEAQPVIGDATETNFAQDLYIAKSGDTILMYRGNTEPATYPSGTYSLIASASNQLAPGVGDTAWKNSVALQNSTDYFVQLESGYFAYFNVDTVAADFIVLGQTQYQSILSLRLFNPFVF